MVRENDPRIEHMPDKSVYCYRKLHLLQPPNCVLIKKVQIDVTALTNDIFKFLVTCFKISPAIAKDMLTMTSLLSTWKAFISF